jgi:dihydrodipicolinate reductase
MLQVGTTGIEEEEEEEEDEEEEEEEPAGQSHRFSLGLALLD